jgi:hypothetical protein
MSDQCKVTTYQYNTPLGSFEAKFDNVHEHHYPQQHVTNWGGNLRTIDNTTRKTIETQRYNLQVDLKPLRNDY